VRCGGSYTAPDLRESTKGGKGKRGASGARAGERKGSVDMNETGKVANNGRGHKEREKKRKKKVVEGQKRWGKHTCKNGCWSHVKETQAKKKKKQPSDCCPSVKKGETLGGGTQTTTLVREGEKSKGVGRSLPDANVAQELVVENGNKV